MSEVSDSRQEKFFGPTTWLIVAVAAFLRFLLLDQQGLWFDEFCTIRAAKEPWADLLRMLAVVESAKPPLYFAVMHEWIRLGIGDALVRIPSVVFGVVACLAAAVIGRRLLGPRSGWLLGLFVALSPMHVWYSQEARMYALFTAVGFTALVFLLRFLESRSFKDLAGYTLFAILTCYTFTYGPFLAVFATLFAFLRQPKVEPRLQWQLLGANAVTALAFAPWILVMLETASSGRGVQPFPTPLFESFAYTFFTLGFGFTLGPTSDALRANGRRIFQVEPFDSAVLVAGSLLLGLLVLWGLAIHWKRNRPAFYFSTLGILMFWPMALLPSLLKPGVPYLPRYTILALVPVGLAVVGVIGQVPVRRWLGIPLAVFALGVAVSLRNFYFDEDYWRDDLRAAAQFANGVSPRPEKVVISPEYLVASFSPYYSGGAPVELLTLTGPGADEQLATLRQSTAGAKSWLLIYARPFHGDPKRMLPGWLDENFAILDRKKWTGVEVFTLAPRTPQE